MPRLFVVHAIAAMGMLAQLPAAAAARAEEAAPASQVQPIQHAAECFCRAQGRMFAVGETICLRTPGGPRLAQCALEVNVTSWRLSEQVCPES
jgi:hypothetical protein